MQLYVGYFMMLPVTRLHSVDERMNGKGFRRKKLWPNQGTTPEFAWRDGGNP
jgi:hypothetical protein